MSASVNGKDVLNCLISEPRVGAWSAEFDADCDESLIGGIVLHVDGYDWVGTIQRGDVESGRLHCRVIAGRGGLGKKLDAKFYVGVSLGNVLNDIMRITREELSDKTDHALLSRVVPRWTRSNASAGQALRQVAEEAGVSWRVLRDGTVWLGKETWADVGSVAYDEIARAPNDASMMIAPDKPTIVPGCTFMGKRVSRVSTRVSAASLRQEVIFEDSTTGDAPPQSRMARDIAGVVESLVGNRIDYTRWYSAKVIKQASDGTLELLADNPKVRGNGITKVPIRHGVPGMRVKLFGGSRVMLFFENGDPKAPAAALWPDGSSVQEVSISAPTVRIEGNLEVTGEVTAKASTPAAVTLSKHKHPTAVGPTSEPIPGT